MLCHLCIIYVCIIFSADGISEDQDINDTAPLHISHNGETPQMRGSLSASESTLETQFNIVHADKETNSEEGLLLV